MERKAVSGIMLTLLLISMLTLALNIQPVKAQGPINILFDGRVYPPTAPILNVGNVSYTLMANINNSIMVHRSNIIIDGNGYTLQGTGSGNGFDLSNINHVTIKKTRIKGFNMGIYLFNCSGCVISRNNITDNKYSGVYLDGSSSNFISGNNITNNDGYGVYLWNSSDNVISGNNLASNGYDGVYLLNCSDNVISGNNLASNGYHGVYLWNSRGSVISVNNITKSPWGIFFGNYSYYNRLYENNITNNSWYGVYITNCSDNVISRNNFINNIEKQASTLNSINVWDGNYWSNYTGVDNYSGPYQNETGSDGVGDTPHIIDATNKDRYPLMNLWHRTQTKLTLLTLYRVNLYVNGTLTYGSSLKLRFYSYSGVYQGVATVWSGTTPRHVLLSTNITHPLNKAIENVTLVLTDGAGTTLETLTTFLVRRTNLFSRITQIMIRWPFAPSAERITLFREIVDISKQWPYAQP